MIVKHRGAKHVPCSALHELDLRLMSVETVSMIIASALYANCDMVCFQERFVWRLVRLILHASMMLVSRNVDLGGYLVKFQ